MKSLMVLCVCLLIAISGVCQDGYPRVVVLEGDTAVLLTPSQVRKLNIYELDLRRSEGLNQVLEGKIAELSNIVELQRKETDRNAQTSELMKKALEEASKKAVADAEEVHRWRTESEKQRKGKVFWRYATITAAAVIGAQFLLK